MSKRVFPKSSERASEKRNDDREEWFMDQLSDPVKGKAYDKYLRDHERRIRRLQREAKGEFVPGDYDNGYDE